MMTENPNRQKLKKFYNTLEDRPLDPSAPYYSPFLQESETDPIAELANRISLSAAESVNLFSGQRGCGKSTEFRRLKQELEQDDCEVYLLDMREYMNLTVPVEINDFLISIMIAFSDQIKAQHHSSPANRSYLDRLIHFLNTDVNIDSIGFQNINASLKDDPTFKQRLQQDLQGHTARIVQEAHTFAKDAVKLIRKKTKDPHKKVVILVDSVEQIRGVGIEGSLKVHKSVENLFSGHATSLQIPMLHTVYTIPPYLPALVQGVGRQLGGKMTCTLPSIHVQNQDNSLDIKGLEIMQDLVERRYPCWKDFFTIEQLNTLASASGGDLRDFFSATANSLG